MASQPASQIIISSTGKATSTAVSSRQQVSNSKGNSQLQEEWGDEDGEFELEDDDIAQTEQSVSEKQESIGHAEDDQKGDNTFLNQQQSSINFNSPCDDKSPSKQASSSSSPLSQNADAQENDDSPKTKSGRKVQKPILFTPEAKKSSSDTKKRPVKRQRRSSNVAPRNSPKEEVTIKIEQELDQVVADDVVCILCHDGNSPKHNRIVLCDECDDPYHQQCHKPFIEDRVVEIPDAEWMCSKCDDLHGNKRRKVEIDGATSASVAGGGSSRREISGDGLTEDQKIAYLSSLPQRVLIDLILIAEKLHPDLPLYPADVKEKISNNVYAGDRSSDPSVLATSASLPQQSYTSQISIPSQPPQNYSSTSVNNNPSRAHLPAVGIDLPSYEEMIVQALASIADPAGSAPRNIFDWMNSKYPLHKNFRASASQALQKAVKKGRVFRIGTVYKINPNYRPAKRTRRFYKRPGSNESSVYNDDDDDDDDDDDSDVDNDDDNDDAAPDTDSHSGHDGIYEIAVRLDDNDNFTSVHSLDMDEHTSLTSSAVSSPLPNAISNGHTVVTTPETNSPLGEIPNKIISVMVNEPPISMSSIIPNPLPVMSRNMISTINSQTLPPVQQTLPPLSSVTFFGSDYGGNKQNSIFYSPLQTEGYNNTGLPSIHSTSLSQGHENVQGSRNYSLPPTGAMYLQ